MSDGSPVSPVSSGATATAVGAPVREMSRRTVLRTAVWATPVIAATAAAPAFAASCVQRYAGTLDWASNYTRASTSSASGTIAFANGVTTAYTVASTFSNYTATTANLTITTPVGGTGNAGLTLFQAPNQSGTTGILNPKPTYFSNDRTNNQIVTITFATPVYDVSFLLTDIDSATGDFIDGAEVSMTNTAGAAATYTATTPTGSTATTGTGAAGSPFRQAGDNTAADNNTGVGGNKAITAVGPIKTISVRYWNMIGTTAVDSGTSPDQAMFIGRITMTTLNASC